MLSGSSIATVNVLPQFQVHKGKLSTGMKCIFYKIVLWRSYGVTTITYIPFLESIFFRCAIKLDMRSWCHITPHTLGIYICDYEDSKLNQSP